MAGIGFTVSLFIAELSFDGAALDEAKVGILAASVLATGLGWAVFRGIELLSRADPGRHAHGDRRAAG